MRLPTQIEIDILEKLHDKNVSEEEKKVLRIRLKEEHERIRASYPAGFCA